MKNPSVCAFPSNRTTITHSHIQQCQLHTTQKWIHRECKHEIAIVKQKESELFDAIPIHRFKWRTGQMTQDRFVFITISITPWTTNPLNIRFSIHPYSSVTVPGDNYDNSRQSDWVNEKTSIMYANAIRVMQVQIYLDSWMISDKSIYLSQMNTLESCRWPVGRYLRYGEWKEWWSDTHFRWLETGV